MRKKTLARKNLNNPQIRSYVRAVKKGLKSQHVIPIKDGWAVKKAGASRPSKIFATQKKAVREAERISKKNKVDLFIHKSDSRIKSRKSFR